MYSSESCSVQIVGRTNIQIRLYVRSCFVVGSMSHNLSNLMYEKCTSVSKICTTESRRLDCHVHDCSHVVVTNTSVVVSQSQFIIFFGQDHLLELNDSYVVTNLPLFTQNITHNHVITVMYICMYANVCIYRHTHTHVQTYIRGVRKCTLQPSLCMYLYMPHTCACEVLGVYACMYLRTLTH